MHFIDIRCVSLVFMYVKLDSDSYSHIRMESREYYKHLFTIAGTNPYSWTLTDPRGSIILNKCYNILSFLSEYESNLTYVLVF